jgi:hypothetical protein
VVHWLLIVGSCLYTVFDRNFAEINSNQINSNWLGFIFIVSQLNIIH